MNQNAGFYCVSASDKFSDFVNESLRLIDEDLVSKLERLPSLKTSEDSLRLMQAEYIVVDLVNSIPELTVLIETLIALQRRKENSPTVVFVGQEQSLLESELHGYIRSSRIPKEELHAHFETMLSSAGSEEQALAAESEKKSQVAVRESELAFRSIFAQSAVGIAVIDSKEMKYLKVNDRYCKITGRTKPDLSAKFIEELADECQLHETLQQVLKFYADGFQEFSFSGSFSREDGEHCRAKLTLTPAYFGSDQSLQHFVILQEIHDELQTIDSANTGAAELRDGIVQGIPGACCFMDRDFTIRSVNHVFATQFGTDGFIGLPVEELIGSQVDLQRVEAELMEQGRVTFPLGKGESQASQFWILESAFLGTGDGVFWMAKGHDVSPAKRNSNSLAFEDNLSRLSKYAGIGYWILDLPNDRIQFSVGPRGIPQVAFAMGGTCYSDWLKQFATEEKKAWLTALQQALEINHEHERREVTFEVAAAENPNSRQRRLTLQACERLAQGEMVFGIYRIEE